MRILPKTIFGRLLMLLTVSLVVSQIIITFVFLHDRQDIIHKNRWHLIANKVANTVELFNRLEEEQHPLLLKTINSPGIKARFIPANKIIRPHISPPHNNTAKRLYSMLKNSIGEKSEIRVRHKILKPPPKENRLRGNNRWRKNRGTANGFIIQIQINNGKWLEIKSRSLYRDNNPWPLKLVIASAIVLVFILIASFIFARFITKPLVILGNAAEKFGKSITTTPIEEKGTAEIANTAAAFNKMQRNLQTYISDRNRILSAVSHDLKTPITRMRLRTEMLDNEKITEKFIYDLDEMNSMINGTLEFMRGESAKEAPCEIDFSGFIETIGNDWIEMGKNLKTDCPPNITTKTKPLSIKRAINNLINNAFRYSESVSMLISVNEEIITIKICDKGPGIREEMLEKVFDPFEQLDSSRNKNNGGHGLGLSIARNIIRANAGELKLYNAKEGGLCAEINIPIQQI
ncbi:MAG: HAMP domain-containing protein [Gammaproteobacteria bacterium]|nr:MAG: HAMP domain-containing protein [Gammaproteobacteria bacterium]